MATYKQIQDFVKSNFGVSVKTCHIAHVKHVHGFVMRPAPNRKSLDARVFECPDRNKVLIETAMKHFKML